MKIYSWNMLFRNQDTERAFAFITSTDFDVFCLQEVPENVLERLQALPYHLSFRTDVFRVFTGGTSRNYVVTLSKHPIVSHGQVAFPDYWPFLPWRARFFVRLMRRFHFSKMQERGGLYTDIQMPEQIVRVFNLHLILAHPEWRLREFESALAERHPTHPAIVCGDFNILEAPHITPLNWLMGTTLGHAVFYKRERTHIEKRFVEYELQNPLRGKITHPFSLSQLDHILVSHSLSIKNAEVLPDRTGSDHHPIRVEIS